VQQRPLMCRRAGIRASSSSSSRPLPACHLLSSAAAGQHMGTWTVSWKTSGVGLSAGMQLQAIRLCQLLCSTRLRHSEARHCQTCSFLLGLVLPSMLCRSSCRRLGQHCVPSCLCPGGATTLPVQCWRVPVSCSWWEARAACVAPARWRGEHWRHGLNPKCCLSVCSRLGGSYADGVLSFAPLNSRPRRSVLPPDTLCAHRYCSRSCQAADWAKHKVVCAQLSGAAAAEAAAASAGGEQ
jgi:hypothetical protein